MISFWVLEIMHLQRHAPPVVPDSRPLPFRQL